MLNTKVLQRLVCAKQLLEAHHTKPAYRIASLARGGRRQEQYDRQTMSWRKQSYQNKGEYWDQGQYWDWPPKVAKKNGNGREKAAEKDKGAFFTGYDGKKVRIGGNSSSSQSSSTWQQEKALKEENEKLKSMIRKAAQGERTPELEADFLKVTAEDPREALKEKQRLLNQERKCLNRSAKIKDEMEKHGKQFSAWKEGFQKGLIDEEKRHEQAMAEVREALREAEKSKENDEDDYTVDLTDEDPRIVALNVEIQAMKGQMEQMASYTTRMERTNQCLAEQVQALVSAMQGSTLTHGGLTTSPDQVTRTPKIRVKREASQEPEQEKKRREGRSRSPMREDPGEMAASGLQDGPMDPEEMKEVLLNFSENAQLAILNKKNAEPDKYRSTKAMYSLFEEFKNKEKGINPLGPDLGNPVMAPFGKANRAREVAAHPYCTSYHNDAGGSVPDDHTSTGSEQAFCDFLGFGQLWRYGLDMSSFSVIGCASFQGSSLTAWSSMYVFTGIWDLGDLRGAVFSAEWFGAYQYFPFEKAAFSMIKQILLLGLAISMVCWSQELFGVFEWLITPHFRLKVLPTREQIRRFLLPLVAASVCNLCLLESIKTQESLCHWGSAFFISLWKTHIFLLGGALVAYLARMRADELLDFPGRAAVVASKRRKVRVRRPSGRNWLIIFCLVNVVGAECIEVVQKCNPTQASPLAYQSHGEGPFSPGFSRPCGILGSTCHFDSGIEGHFGESLLHLLRLLAVERFSVIGNVSRGEAQ